MICEVQCEWPLRWILTASEAEAWRFQSDAIASRRCSLPELVNMSPLGTIHLTGRPKLGPISA